MEIPVELPLDGDGYLRRECPYCEEQFKWLPGGTGSAPADFVDPPVYCCPLCGRSAPQDAWLTTQQLAYAEQVFAGEAHEFMAEALGGTLKLQRDSMFQIEVTMSDRPGAPDPLVETDDMMIVVPPCHAWEPLKVPEQSAAPYHCLLCGQAFAV